VIALRSGALSVAIVAAAAVLVDFAANIPLGSVPLMLASHAPAATAVHILSCAAVFGLLGSLPAGMFIDRKGAKRALLASTATMTVALLTMAIWPTPLCAALAMTVRGAAGSAFVAAALTYASVSQARDAFAAVSAVGVAANLAFAVSPALGSALWDYGVHAVQYLFCALAGLAALALCCALPDRRGGPDTMSVLAFDRRWIKPLLFAASVALCIGLNATLAILAFRARGLNGALILSATALATVAFRFPATALVKSWGARNLAAAVAVCQLTGAALAAVAVNTPALIVSGLLIGMAWSAVLPLSTRAMFALSTGTQRGTFMGAYGLFVGCGVAAGSGLANAGFLFQDPYVAASLLCGAAPLACLLLFQPMRAVQEA
jgi:MFS family permease